MRMNPVDPPLRVQKKHIIHYIPHEKDTVVHVHLGLNTIDRADDDTACGHSGHAPRACGAGEGKYMDPYFYICFYIVADDSVERGDRRQVTEVTHYIILSHEVYTSIL